jgi:hypothetical protein
MWPMGAMHLYAVYVPYVVNYFNVVNMVKLWLRAKIVGLHTFR